MSTLIKDFLKGFEKIISKDSLRESMGVVLIKDGCAVSTDGAKLIKADLKLYGLSDEDKSNLEGCCIDLEQLLEIRTKKSQHIKFSKKTIEIYSSGKDKPLKKIELSTESELGFTFPRYESILGKQESSLGSISVDYNHMLDVQNVYENIDSTSDLITVFTGIKSYVRLQNIDGSFHAIVMPLMKNDAYKDLSK